MMQIISKTTISIAAVTAAFPVFAQAPTTVPTEAEVRSVIYKNIQRVLNVPEEDVVDDANFVNDFGLDSLDAIELVMQLEDRFFISIPSEDIENANTVGEMITAVFKQTEALKDKDRIKFAGYALEGVEVGTMLRKGKSWQGLYAENTHDEIFPPKFAELDGLIFTGYQFYRTSRQNGKVGLIDKAGKTIIKPKYSTLEGVSSNPDFIVATDKKGKHYLFTTGGDLVFKRKSVEPVNVDPSGRFVKAKAEDGRLGILDLEGKWVIEPEWTDISIHDEAEAKGFVLFKGPTSGGAQPTYQFRDINLKGSGNKWMAMLIFDHQSNRYITVNDRIPWEASYRTHFSVRDEAGNWSVVNRIGAPLFPKEDENAGQWVYGYYNAETGTVAAKLVGSEYWGVMDAKSGERIVGFWYDATLPHEWKDDRRICRVFRGTQEWKVDDKHQRVRD